MGRRSSDGYILALDAGTGTVRALLFSLKGERIHRETQPRQYAHDPILGALGCLFDPDAFWSVTCNLIRAVLRNTGVSPEAIRAVSASGQRFSYVFLDRQDGVLYAGPNLDARGAFIREDIEGRLDQAYYSLTGQWPALLSALARLLWFRQEAPAVFSRIGTVLMLNDWILQKLCGAKRSEVTAASGSGLVDVTAKQWSERIQKTFDLDPGLFPTLARSDEVIGEVLPRAAVETGLHPGTPVVAGGADTQCALLGAGVRGDGQTGIVAGTTAAACLLMDTPYVDHEKRFWTSCHLDAEHWVLEANTQWAGYVVQWMKDVLINVREKACQDSEVYAWIERKASEAPAGSHDTLAFLGPVIMEDKVFHFVPPGVFHFPPPAHPLTAFPAQASHFLRAMLENIAFALCANHERLLTTRPSLPERIYATGGLTQSRLFCQILADCLRLPVTVGRIREASALGAAICAAAGIQAFASMAEAQEGMVQEEEVFEPKPENVEAYRKAYARWIEIYGKLDRLQG
jgi:autoinducer-2 kinase